MRVIFPYVFIKLLFHACDMLTIENIEEKKLKLVKTIRTQDIH